MWYPRLAQGPPDSPTPGPGCALRLWEQGQSWSVCRDRLRQCQGAGKTEKQPNLGKSEMRTRHGISQFLLLKSLLIMGMYLLIICDLL